MYGGMIYVHITLPGAVCEDQKSYIYANSYLENITFSSTINRTCILKILSKTPPCTHYYKVIL